MRSDSASYFREYRSRPGNAFEKRLERNRSIIDDAKSVPCADCGTSYPTYVMDLDHVRGEKTIAVSKMLTAGTARLVEEIAKCEAVCANCHRERTHGGPGIGAPA